MPDIADAHEIPDSECSEFDPHAPEPVTGPLCDKEGEIIDTHGGEHYWHCDRPGTVNVPSGRKLCEDHAGELGYGPKQEEYGFDPADEPKFADVASCLSCLSCSRGEDGGGYPCGCPSPCGARYCQHPVTDTIKEN